MSVKLGDPVPLVLQLAGAETDRFVKCTVRNPLNVQLSVLQINHVANGLYANWTYLMPNVSALTLQYQVFTDSSFTTLDPTYFLITDIVNLQATGGGGGGGTTISNVSATPLIGVVDFSFANQGGRLLPIQNRPFDLIFGEDKSITVRLFKSDTGAPFDLTAQTSVTASLPNADGLSSVVKRTSDGSIVMIAAAAGLFSISLASADAISLGLIDLEIVIDLGTGARTICQMRQCLYVHSRLWP